MGVACRHLLRGTRVPYTVALLVLGIALGALEYGTELQLGRVGDGIRLWANIDPDLLLAVFLPALIFESCFSMEARQIKRCMVQMLLLAGPGVFISTFCIGSALKRASNDSLYLSPETGALLLFFTGGTVFLTLIINGSTTQFLLKFFGMDELSLTESCILNYTKYQMMTKALEAHAKVGDDEVGPLDWHTIKRSLMCLNNLEPEGVHPHVVSVCDLNLEVINLKATRVRLLKAVQAAYLRMLDEGIITQATANVLMKSVDEASDLASEEPLCDWNSLKAQTAFLNDCKLLQTSILPQKLVRYITIEKLQSAYDICAAFLRAHSIARKKLHEFIGNDEVTSVIINESEAEETEARKFLEDVHVAFPQVLHAVEAREATYSVLNVLSDYVQNLENDGLLEEKVMLHLRDLVETDFKRLVQNPPSLELRQLRDVISLPPFMGTLPPMVCEAFEGSMKEMFKPSGVLLCKEGSEPNSLWLITNGLVKCKGKILKDRYCLQASFSQGCIVGLYEVLIGKPYICDMSTDSIVLCHSMEADSVLSVLRSSPEVADVFWKECIIFLAKLLLPEVFEKVSMNELRALVAEKSTMTICMREETVEIPNHSIGLLLEGSLRAQDLREEVIESPVALLPLYGNPDFLGLKISDLAISSSCNWGSQYMVERVARIAYIDISSWRSNCVVPSVSSPS